MCHVVHSALGIPNEMDKTLVLVMLTFYVKET